jgi:predicted RNA-binding protein with RPS1 domain
MAMGYIRDPHEKVSVGDTLRFWVVEADTAKSRVSLTLLSPTAKQTPTEDKERAPRAPRPPRPEGDRQKFADKPRESHPPGEGKRRENERGDKRFDRSGGQSRGRSFERTPKTFVSAPVKKEVKPITEKMKQGKEPMRSFGDLAQLFGRVQVEAEKKKEEEKK